MGFIKAIIAKIISAIINGLLRVKPEGASPKMEKPTNILAQIICAKIIENADKVQRKYWVCGISENTLPISEMWVFCKDKNGKAYGECDIRINGKDIKLSGHDANLVASALIKAHKIGSAKRKAEAEAKNETNALDAIAEIFNIGKPE